MTFKISGGRCDEHELDDIRGDKHWSFEVYRIQLWHTMRLTSAGDLPCVRWAVLVPAVLDVFGGTPEALI